MLEAPSRWTAFHEVKRLVTLKDVGFAHIQLYHSVPAVLVEVRRDDRVGWSPDDAKLFELRKSKGKRGKKKWVNPRKLAQQIDNWIFDKAFKQFRLEVHEI